MYKKILVLFLMAAFSVIILPSEGEAAVVTETTSLVNTLTPGAALFLQRGRNRRWRNRNKRRIIRRSIRRNNRRNDRRDDRRDDRRNNRRNRGNNRNY